MSFNIGTSATKYNFGNYNIDNARTNNFYLSANDGTDHQLNFGDGFKSLGVINTDDHDTVTLSNKWHLAASNITTDQGVTGTEYDSADGGKIVIGGSGKVNCNTGASDKLTDTDKANFAQLDTDIDAIEHDQKNLDAKGAIDKTVGANEIQNALDDGKLGNKGTAKYNFWQGIIANFSKYDVTNLDPRSGLQNMGGDGLINAGDIFNAAAFDPPPG
jgi:hypothetical protein